MIGTAADPQPSKRCTKCGETKPLTEFTRYRRSPDGHFWWCKTCKNTAYRDAHYVRQQAAPRPEKPSKWVPLQCEWCGNEMRYRRADIEGRQRRGEPLPRFCSRRCAGKAARQPPARP